MSRRSFHRYQRGFAARKRYRETGAFAFFRFDGHLPVMGLHQRLDDGEPEPGSALSSVRLTETFEYDRQKSGRDADPGVFDLNLDFVVSMAQPDGHGAARGSKAQRVAHEVDDDLDDAILVSEHALKEFGLTPLARFVGFAVAGVPPEIMGIGPIAAIPKVLKTTGVRQDDLDWIELNEAFAAQSLAVIRDLGLDPATVNPLGGAIALGHPLGATGAIRTATLVHGLKRRKQKYGMITMCVGTGMGAAGIFEAL